MSLVFLGPCDTLILFFLHTPPSPHPAQPSPCPHPSPSRDPPAQVLAGPHSLDTQATGLQAGGRAGRRVGRTDSGPTGTSTRRKTRDKPFTAKLFGDYISLDYTIYNIILCIIYTLHAQCTAEYTYCLSGCSTHYMHSVAYMPIREYVYDIVADETYKKLKATGEYKKCKLFDFELSSP